MKESPLDSEIKARIIGVEAQMNDFNFLFGVSLGALILTHSDNLSKALQKSSMSASEGQYLAKLALDVLKSLRQPDQFTLFFQRILSKSPVHLYLESAVPLNTYKLALAVVTIIPPLKNTTECFILRL